MKTTYLVKVRYHLVDIRGFSKENQEKSIVIILNNTDYIEMNLRNNDFIQKVENELKQIHLIEEGAGPEGEEPIIDVIKIISIKEI